MMSTLFHYIRYATAIIRDGGDEKHCPTCTFEPDQSRALTKMKMINEELDHVIEREYGRDVLENMVLNREASRREPQ